MPLPRKWNEYQEGWDFSVYANRVELGWTTHGFHGSGPKPAEGKRHESGSHCGRALYATRLDALIALRAAHKAEAEKRLAGVDAEIARERENPTP